MEAYYNRSVAKSRLASWAKAIRDYDEAIRLRPNNAEAYLNRGISKARLGHWNEAKKDLDKAIITKPDIAEAYHSRGITKNNLGLHEEVTEDYNKAIRISLISPKLTTIVVHQKANLGDMMRLSRIMAGQSTWSRTMQWLTTTEGIQKKALAAMKMPSRIVTRPSN